MRTLLRLFQIKTVRSAWVFLHGSVMMALFPIYLLYVYPVESTPAEQRNFQIGFFALWFLITASYVALASWVLFSSNGRQYLAEEEAIPTKGHRTLIWFFKFLFACYVAGFATLMLLAVVAMPMVGYAGFEFVTSAKAWLYFVALGLVWSPFVFKHLK